jgi:tetratricopeptide (TPR) repeat protein
MARAQLAGFPANQWEDLQQVEAVAPSIVWFEKAVQYDSHNRTALHRLGLVALLGRDFPTAVSYLERAYRVDSQYRGIRKTLAYSEIWSQNLAQALPLLRQLPEAQGELEAYIGWWGSQDRSDLAALAEEASHALSGGTSLHIQGWNEPDLVIWENLSLGPGK